MGIIARAWLPPEICTTKTCADRYHQVFARKFSSKKLEYEEAMNVADSAADAWDAKMKQGLFACPHDSWWGRVKHANEHAFKGEL